MVHGSTSRPTKTTVQVYQARHRGAEASKAREAVGKAWLGNRPEQQPNQTGAEGKTTNEKANETNKNRRQKELAARCHYLQQTNSVQI